MCMAMEIGELSREEYVNLVPSLIASFKLVSIFIRISLLCELFKVDFNGKLLQCTEVKFFYFEKI